MTTSGDGHEHCAICFPCCPSGMCSIMYCLVHICPKAKILGFCCTGLVEHVMLTWTSRGDGSRKKINDIFRCPNLDGMGFVAGTSVRFEQNFRGAVHSYLGLCLSRCNMNRTCLESSAAQECLPPFFASMYSVDSHISIAPETVDLDVLALCQGVPRSRVRLNDSLHLAEDGACGHAQSGFQSSYKPSRPNIWWQASVLPGACPDGILQLSGKYKAINGM